VGLADCGMVSRKSRNEAWSEIPSDPGRGRLFLVEGCRFSAPGDEYGGRDNGGAGAVDGVKDKSCVSSALQGFGAKLKILLRRMIVSSQLHSALIDSPIHYCSRCVEAGSPSEAHDRGGEGLPKRLVEIRAAALPS
jgi:hypothetical protein